MRITVVVVGVFALLTGCGSSSGNNNNDMGGGGGGDMAGGGGGGGDMAMGGGFSCSQGTLYAGNPLYNGTPSDRPTSGTGIKADPPLQWQTLVFSGNFLYTRQESELWFTDTSAAAPVETRIAGMTPTGSTYDFKAGACSAASFSQLRGLAALSDGSLIASDYWADSIVKISHPNDSGTCTVTVVAGSAGPLTGLDPSVNSTLPTPGNADGQGSAATFNAPTALVADSAGTVYVVDQKVSNGANLVRKIDASGNVTTLATLGTNPGAPMTIHNFTILGGALYAAAGDTTNNGYVIKIDTSNGTVTQILGGGSDKFPPVDSGRDPDISGITNDGTNLFVAGDGYVWYLTLSGTLTLLAGTGNSIDFFPTGYDPTVAHPALELALPTAIGSADENATGAFNHITFHSGAIYYRGFANGTSDFIERIACP